MNTNVLIHKFHFDAINSSTVLIWNTGQNSHKGKNLVHKGAHKGKKTLYTNSHKKKENNSHKYPLQGRI